MVQHTTFLVQTSRDRVRTGRDLAPEAEMRPAVPTGLVSHGIPAGAAPNAAGRRWASAPSSHQARFPGFPDAHEPSLCSVQGHHSAGKIPSIPQSCLGIPSKHPRLRGRGHPFLAERSICPQSSQAAPPEPGCCAEGYRGPGAGPPFSPGCSHRSASHRLRPRPQPSRAPVFSSAVSAGAAVPRRERESGGSRPESLPLAPSLIHCLSGPPAKLAVSEPGACL